MPGLIRLPRAAHALLALIKAALSLAACALCGAASAQTVSTAGDLSFGTFVVTAAGSVTVQASGMRTQAGGVHLLSQGGTHAAAIFNLKGKANAVYAITLPANNSVLLRNAAGQTMAVGNFTSNLSDSNVLNRSGNGQFRVGATLSVGAAQPRGSYSGTFNITVNYQ